MLIIILAVELGIGSLDVSNDSADSAEKDIQVEEIYFAGETAEFIANYLPEEAYLIDPNGYTTPLSFEKSGGLYIAKYRFEKGVVLGEYKLIADEIEKSFLVDFCELNVSYEGGFFNITANTFFSEPKFVFSIDSENGEGIRNISVPVTEGQHDYSVLCGNSVAKGSFQVKFSIELKNGEIFSTLDGKKVNATLRVYADREFVFYGFFKSKDVNSTDFVVEAEYNHLKVKKQFIFSLDKEIYFPGEEIVFRTSFSNVVRIIDPANREFFAEARDGIAIFPLDKDVLLGEHKAEVDGIEKNFFVDFYSINASYNGSKIFGHVRWHLVKPSYVEYSAGEKTGKVKVLEDGSFEFEIDHEEVLLKCGNAELLLNLKADEKIYEFEGMKFKVSIDRGRFEELDFDGENVNLMISDLNPGEKVNLTVELPFEIPEGMHIYYWKEVDGEIVPISYGISGNKITFLLEDGVLDEDNAANGVIVDPLKFYIPRFKVERELNGRTGTLSVYEMKGEKLYDVKVEVSKGNLSYLAFVDSENLPAKPAEFPYQLLKFRVEGLEAKEEVEVKITYPSLEDLLTDDGVAYYKFSARGLSWDQFSTSAEGNTAILKLKDGGFGDEDGEENGIIEDDGGVGWVGYPGLYGASICRDEKRNEVHVYWLYVPSGQNFTIRVYDGDGLQVRVYYPNATMQGSYTASSNNAWNNFTIQTANSFGWWRIEIFEDSWSADNGNYYGLNVTGADEINIRVNSSYVVDEQTLYGTNDSVIVGEESDLSLSQNYYVFADSFNFSVYDPDDRRTQRLNVTVISPSGTVQGWGLYGNNVWTSIMSVSGDYGVWRINVSQISNYNDYNAGGNHYRLAVNLSEGLYFKPPAVFNINGRVLHDLFPLGNNSGEDQPIRGVEVLLVEDINRNKIPDSGDRILRRNITDANGNFSFRALKDITKTYFVVVNSKSINATNASLSYNSGYSTGHVWAEQTYQTNDSSYSQVIPFFGGRSELSDNVSYVGTSFAGRAEHFIVINCSSYNNETLYFGFNFSVIANTRDADDDENPRYCQGCLRQFVLNSNAISGKQRSYFVMKAPANASDVNGSWWLIWLNASLGSLYFTDSVEFDATVLNESMSIVDSNAGCIGYSYETAEIVNSCNAIPVGVGIDGVPFSGDEALLYPIQKPEIEIYGSTLNPVIQLNATADLSVLRNFSIFGSQSNAYPGGVIIYANNSLVENVLSGLRANGSDPKPVLNRTGGAGFWIEGNNTTVRNAIVAFAERYGLLFYNSSVKKGFAENVISFKNGRIVANDNIGIENFASNVTVDRCVSAKAAAVGIETWNADSGIRIFNCTVERNAEGNDTGVVSEFTGIRVNANDSLIAYNLVRFNNGHGVLITGSPLKPVVSNVTLTKNSIYSNARLGIDLNNDNTIAHRGDNVTLNDGLLNCSQTNCGVDYPVITYADLDGDTLYLEGFIGREDAGGSKDFANATVEFYLVRNSTGGDDLIGNNWTVSSILPKSYGEGWIYLGATQANGSGYFNETLNIAEKGVEQGSLISAITILNGNTSEFGSNSEVLKKLNVSADILLQGLNATIKVKAFEKAKDVKVYWIKPSGLDVSYSGDYNFAGSQDGVYWWKFNQINAGEERFVHLNFSGTNFMLIDALNIAIDP